MVVWMAVRDGCDHPRSLAIARRDLALLPRLVTIGLAMAPYLAGARTPAAEVGLMSVIDVAVGPLRTGLAFSERVGPSTILGGSVVVVAVVGHLVPDPKRLARID